MITLSLSNNPVRVKIAGEIIGTISYYNNVEFISVRRARFVLHPRRRVPPHWSDLTLHSEKKVRTH
jgi:hypothetical protein